MCTLNQFRKGYRRLCHLGTRGEGSWCVGGTQQEVAHLACLPEPAEQGAMDCGRVVPHRVLTSKEQTWPKKSMNERGKKEGREGGGHLGMMAPARAGLTAAARKS